MGTAPNARLQRTRMRAPLSRKPFGDLACRTRRSTSVMLLSAALALPCLGQEFAVIPIPVTEGRPASVASGHDGNLWFTTGSGNTVASLSLAGTVVQYPLPHPSSWPGQITKGPKESMWFVEIYGQRVAQIDLRGKITEFPLPLRSAVPTSISAAPDGTLWVSGGIHGGGAFLAQVTAEGDFRVRTWPDWNEIAGHAIDRDGTIWLARPTESLLSQLRSDGKVCDIPIYRAANVHPRFPSGVCLVPLDTETVLCGGAEGEFQTYEVGGAPEGLIEDASGTLWVTAFVKNALVSISQSGDIQYFLLPVPRALARSVTVGPDGAIWLLGSRPPSAYRFQPPSSGIK